MIPDIFWLLMGVGDNVTVVRCEVSVKRESSFQPELNYALMVLEQLLKFFFSRLSFQVSFISSLASKLCRSFRAAFWGKLFATEMILPKLLVSCKHAHMMSIR